LSTTTTCAPLRAASYAATRPATPQPTTTTALEASIFSVLVSCRRVIDCDLAEELNNHGVQAHCSPKKECRHNSLKLQYK
jgi:hypothetical protein